MRTVCTVNMGGTHSYFEDGIMEATAVLPFAYQALDYWVTLRIVVNSFVLTIFQYNRSCTYFM